MAVQDLATNLSAALPPVIAPRLLRQFNRLAVTASLLTKAPGHGKNCAWDVMFDAATAAVHGDGTDVTVFDVDTPVPATLDWGHYLSAFSVTELAQSAAATSGVPDALVSLVETSADNSAMKIASTINAAVFNGSGANAVIGLKSALAATGNYANIAKATYAGWAGNVSANGGTPRTLTKALMDSMEATIYRKCGMSPSAIVMTPESVTKYESLFDSVTRTMLSPGNDLSAISRGGSTAAVIPDLSGFTGLTYKGIPVFRDRDCVAGEIYFINSNHATLVVLPAPAITTSQMASQKALSGAVGGNALGMGVRMSSLAKTGTADKWFLNLFVQLKVDRVNCHGIIDDIDES